MSLRDKKPALLLIDLQQAFLDEDYWGGNRNNPNAEAVCSDILNKWRELNLPLFHIRHSSQDENSLLHASKEGFAFSELIVPLPSEPLMTKNVNSAFIGTNLKEILEAQNIDTLVIVGLTTNHCISTTTRMAGNFGFETYLISDSTATFDRVGVDGEIYDADLMHYTALASLNEEFATVIDSEELFEIL